MLKKIMLKKTLVLVLFLIALVGCKQKESDEVADNILNAREYIERYEDSYQDDKLLTYYEEDWYPIRINVYHIVIGDEHRLILEAEKSENAYLQTYCGRTADREEYTYLEHYEEDENNTIVEFIDFSTYDKDYIMITVNNGVVDITTTVATISIEEYK